MGINEQVETNEVCDECGAMQMSEGECMECGYSGGEMGEGKKFPDLTGDGKVTYADILKGRGVKPKGSKTDKAIKKVNKVSARHGMEEETGHLDDIYKVRDLNLKHGDFDYVEGGGNDYGTFEGMHKNLYKEDESDEFVNYDDNFEDPDNENDGFEDLEAGEELGEQGGNVDDMDTDSVEPAYDFESEGPGGVYPVKEYETMESAWANEELDEVDISGSQGIYGAMDPAYDFDSEGPGKGGPYQEFSYGTVHNDTDNGDMDSGEELYPSFSSDGQFTGMSKPNGDMDSGEEDEWQEIEEEIWEEIDDDLQEDFKTQKNKIMEMFNRFNKYN